MSNSLQPTACLESHQKLPFNIYIYIHIIVNMLGSNDFHESKLMSLTVTGSASQVFQLPAAPVAQRNPGTGSKRHSISHLAIWWTPSDT